MKTPVECGRFGDIRDRTVAKKGCEASDFIVQPIETRR